MEESNRDILVFCVKLFSGLFAVVGALVFMAIFLGGGEYATLDWVLKIGAFTIVCAVIFSICLMVDFADRDMKIKALEGEKRALLRGKEDVGHALAALQHVTLEGNKHLTALEMRMRVNTIVTGLDLPVRFDPDKLKEWKDKILSTALFK